MDYGDGSKYTDYPEDQAVYEPDDDQNDMEE